MSEMLDQYLLESEVHLRNRRLARERRWWQDGRVVRRRRRHEDSDRTVG